MPRVTDTRIVGYEPLFSPSALFLELPLGDVQSQTVETTRAEVRAVLDGADDRLLVVTGPCSVHDPKAALEYADRLAGLRARFADDLLIVMRVYFEKPRTVTGWKGLIDDPGMDGSYDVHRGLRTARRLLLDILSAGLPVGCEWLDPITPQYIADAVTWGAIGARTTESQVHRQLASGLSMPVGFKNGTDGDVQVAVDACAPRPPATRSSASPRRARRRRHHHRQQRHPRDPAGRPQRPELLVLARDQGAGSALGGGPAAAGDGGRQPRQQRQGLPASDLGGRVAGRADRGREARLVGVMLESFLVAGRQDPGDPATLTYGQSVTDACLDIEMTEAALETLASSVAARRTASSE